MAAAAAMAVTATTVARAARAEVRRVSFALPNNLTVTGKEASWATPNPKHRVLCVHGWMDNCGTWDRLLPLLPTDSHYVMIDLPGHGKSSMLPAYSFVDYCRCIHDVLRTLGWDKYTLMGHSMGAGIMSMYAGTFPANIEKLILIEGGAAISGPAEDFAQLFQQYLQARSDILSKPEKLYADRDAMIDKMLERPFSAEAADCLLNESMIASPDGGHFSFSHDRLLRAPGPVRMTEEQVLSFHRRIECPTLLVTAADGWPFPEGFYQRWTEAIKGPLERCVVPGRHHVHLDSPEVVAPYVSSFISK